MEPVSYQSDYISSEFSPETPQTTNQSNRLRYMFEEAHRDREEMTEDDKEIENLRKKTLLEIEDYVHAKRLNKFKKTRLNFTKRIAGLMFEKIKEESTKYLTQYEKI